MAATPNHGLILKITACIQGGKDAYDIAKILDTATGGALQIAGEIIEACISNLMDIGDDYVKAVFIEYCIRHRFGLGEIAARILDLKSTNHCSKCGHSGHDKNHCTIPAKYRR